MKKIFIIGAIALTMVGCTNKEEKANSVVKEQNVKVEQTKQSTEKEDVYKNYIGEIYEDQGANLEDTEYIGSMITNSQFFDSEYTIGEGLYSVYMDYNCKVSKTDNDKIFDIIYNMNYDNGVGIEIHKMSIKADFNTNKYQLTGLSIDDVKEENKENIDHFINTVKDALITMNEEYEEEQNYEEETEYLEVTDSTQQVDNSSENEKRRILSDFNSGKFYSNKANISNLKMMAKLNLQAKEATEDGYVLVESKIRTNDLQLVFVKSDYYWRIVSATRDGQKCDPSSVEAVILNELG